LKDGIICHSPFSISQSLRTTKKWPCSRLCILYNGPIYRLSVWPDHHNGSQRCHRPRRCFRKLEMVRRRRFTFGTYDSLAESCISSLTLLLGLEASLDLSKQDGTPGLSSSTALRLFKQNLNKYRLSTNRKSLHHWPMIVERWSLWNTCTWRSLCLCIRFKSNQWDRCCPRYSLFITGCRKASMLAYLYPIYQVTKHTYKNRCSNPNTLCMDSTGSTQGA